MNEQNEYVTEEVEMLKKNPKKPGSSGAEELNTVSPLHVNLQVAAFQRCRRVCMFNYISQCVCLAYIVISVYLLQAVVLVCAYFTVLYKVQQYSIFISSPACLQASVKAVVYSRLC